MTVNDILTESKYKPQLRYIRGIAGKFNLVYSRRDYGRTRSYGHFFDYEYLIKKKNKTKTFYLSDYEEIYKELKEVRDKKDV